jgi:hypothetical protein
MFFNYLFTGTTIYNYGSSQTEILINSTANGFKVYKGNSESYINITEESTVFKLIDVGIEAEVLINSTAKDYKIIDIENIIYLKGEIDRVKNLKGSMKNKADLRGKIGGDS